MTSVSYQRDLYRLISGRLFCNWNLFFRKEKVSAAPDNNLTNMDGEGRPRRSVYPTYLARLVRKFHEVILRQPNCRPSVY